MAWVCSWETSLLVLGQVAGAGTGDQCDDLVAVGLDGPTTGDAAPRPHRPDRVGKLEYLAKLWLIRMIAWPSLFNRWMSSSTVSEYRAGYANRSSLLMVKIATGTGAGIVIGGSIYRGEDGAAGDIGHIQLSPQGDVDPPRCRCGNLGCVEAYASGWALVRDLREQGRPVGTVGDLVTLVRDGDPDVRSMTHEAGRVIGMALADAVSLLNPSVVVIGGELGNAADNLVAGIREMVHARSLPLATRSLEIVQTTLGGQAGLTGLSTILTDHIFNPAVIDAQLS